MKYKMHISLKKMGGDRVCAGFIAVVTVMMVAFSALTYSYITLDSSISYADSVARHEWRIQADLNAESCVSTAGLMAAKDYFLEGDVLVPEFGCVAAIERDHSEKTVVIRTQASSSGVSSKQYEQIFAIP